MRTARTKFFAVLLSVSMLVSLLVAPAGAAAFTDVDDWAQPSVDRWTKAGIMEGSADGTFDAEHQMTRAEFAVLLCKLMGYTEESDRSTFTDLPDDPAVASALLKLHKAGVMLGFPNNIAGPNTTIDREQTAVMVFRALGMKEDPNAPAMTYGDADQVSGWAESIMRTMTAKHMIEGDGTNVTPKVDIPKQEMATLLDKMVAVFVAKDGTVSITTKDTAVKAETKNGTTTINAANHPGAVIVQAKKVTITAAPNSSSIVVAPGAPKDTAVTVTGAASDITVAADGAKVTVGKNAEVNSVTMSAANTQASISGKVDSVAVESGADSAKLTVAKGAEVTDVAVEAPKAAVTVSGTVGSVDIAASADNTTVKATTGAKVESVTTSADGVKIDGANKTIGSVVADAGSAEVRAKGAEVSNDGAEVKVDGKPVTEGNTTTSNQTGSGTSTGGGTTVAPSNPEPSQPVVTTYTATFVVKDKDGNAVDTATIEVKSGNDVIDPTSGKTYTLTKDIEYTYTVTAEGYQDFTGTITEPEGDATSVEVSVTMTASTTPPAEETYTATFEVKDSSGQAVDNPTITVKYTEDETEKTVTANADGTYTLTKSITYSYIVKADNYKDFAGTIVEPAAGSAQTKVSVTMAGTDEDTYTVTVTPPTEGGTASADVTDVVKGATVTISATPAEGYALDKITYVVGSGAAQTVTNNTFEMPEGNVTVTVTFTKVAYNITLGTATNGTVKVKVGENGEEKDENITANMGDKITVIPTPTSGYKVSEVSYTVGTKKETITATSDAYTFTMPASDITVSVTFAEDDTPAPAVTIALSDTTGQLLNSKSVSDLVETSGANAAKIEEDSGENAYKATGTVKYVSNWAEFSSNTDETSGYYLPIKLTKNTEQEVESVVVSGGNNDKTFTGSSAFFTEDSDSENDKTKDQETLIMRLNAVMLKDETITIKITFAADEAKEAGTENSVEYTIDCSKLTLGEEQEVALRPNDGPAEDENGDALQGNVQYHTIYNTAGVTFANNIITVNGSTLKALIDSQSQKVENANVNLTAITKPAGSGKALWVGLMFKAPDDATKVVMTRESIASGKITVWTPENGKAYSLNSSSQDDGVDVIKVDGSNNLVTDGTANAKNALVDYRAFADATTGSVTTITSGDASISIPTKYLYTFEWKGSNDQVIKTTTVIIEVNATEATSTSGT